MEQKFIILKVLVFILHFFYITNVLASPMDEMSRVQKIGSQENSLYVRDVMRLAKAADMRNYMNESVDPCTDFYEFACGNWAKINPTTTQSETGYIYQLIRDIKRKKVRLLQMSSSADPMETPIERKVKRFFTSCMNTTIVQQNDWKDEILEVIAEFGTMPALNPKAWNESQFDWMTTIARINSVYGVAIILGSTVMSDMKNNTVNRFYIGQPDLHLEVRSMYLNKSNKNYRDQYRDKIKEELTGAMELPEEKARNIANEIVNFEIELAKGFPDEKADSSLRESITATTVEEMQQKYAPVIDIKKYVLNNFGKPIEGPIYEIEKSYHENLLKVINATSKETLANYIFFRLLTSFLPDKTGTGGERVPYCEKLTEMFFSEITENMVYRRFDSRNTEQDITLMFNEMKKAFRAKLRSNQLNWVSLRTRQSALNKLDTMKFEITSYVDTNFEEEFGSVQIDVTSFFRNIKNLFRNSASYEKAQLYKSTPRKPPGLTFTPLFSHKDNSIKVPVALLQPNYFWSPNYPQAIKFGSIGALLGHELIHGFADHGMKYDELGNQKNWWDVESTVAFQQRIECFKEQYHQYWFGGTLLPRVEAQSENVADNGGLRLAYEAYLGWRTQAERNGEDFSMETLPLLKYSDKKLFFLSFGQVWCNELDRELRAMKVATDEHTPAKFRVIGTLSNFDEFSKEFSCSTNARMNPKNKCVIY